MDRQRRSEHNGRRRQRRPRFDFEDSYIRQTICEEAARIMADQGIRDFQMAKEKAVARLGLVRHRGGLPTNREIDAALLARLRLFDGSALDRRRRTLLQAAAQTMELLADFDPRLVGALLRGTVTERTPVELHLFAETTEAVPDALATHGIRYQCFDKRVRFARKRYARIPSMRFDIDNEPVEVMSFEAKAIREAPLCPVEGRPMRRVSLVAVRDLLRRQGAAGVVNGEQAEPSPRVDDGR